ncbi:unnamed protein product [Cylicocyclus nassatus]|uniref:Uncharacterized protein n=1 Tax=Cylicocyclus nassatus TaxID=53992 RepID=A0AA36GT87_CYLNA|nr:unnamed protein product [Cylicocyclus nassatus]
MSQLGSQKAQFTKAANSLRKKIAEVDQANLDLVDFASEASKDPHLVFNRLNSFSLSFSSISRAASALRGQLEKAEEFARQNPDERGEFPFLSDIHTHWETGGMDDLLEEADALLVRLDSAIRLLPILGGLQSSVPSVAPSLPRNSPPHTTQDPAPSSQHAHQAEVAVHSHSPSRPSDPTASVDQRPLASHTGAHPSGGFGFPSGNPPSNPIHFSQSPSGLPNSLPNPFSHDLQASSSSSLNPFLSLEQPVKLPSYEIPTFSGDIEAFSEFWDIFSTAVHNNNTVPAAVKFMYLKSVLRGDAARIIAGFKPTAKNYDTAVRTILSTYDRPEILRSRLWDKLSQQSPASDSAISQRATLCALQATWYQMRELNEDYSSIATLRTIRSKFPWRTREKVGELKGKSDTMWTVDELLSALSTVIDRLQVVEDSDPAGHRAYNSYSTVRQHSPSPYRYPGTSQPYMRYPSYQQQPAYLRYARSSRSPSPRYRDATYRPPTPYYPRRTSRSPVRPQYTTPWEPHCAFCFRHGHPSECCMTVRDVQQRRELVNQYRLCWLCLEEGHTFNICRAPACRYCGRLHHPALCATLPPAPYSSYPPAQFRQRTPSPRRVQFETTAHPSPPRTQYASPRTSPSRRPTLRQPSPSRRQSRSNSRRATLPRRSSNAFPAVQTSTCTPVAHDSIQSDEPIELLDQHEASLGPHPPSSCTSVCQAASTTQVPRLMVVHAITRNLKTSTDELLTVFLDSGSQYSFICTSLAYHLGLTFKNTRTVTTLTFGGHQFTEDSSEVTLTLWDQLDRPIQLQLWTRDTITTVSKTNNLDEMNNTYMDDRVEVDVLTGIDNYWRVVDLHRNEKLPSGLILSHTRFGPVLSGLSYPVVSEITSSATTLLNDDAPGTEQLLRSLLGLDTLGLDDSDVSPDADVIRQFYDSVRIIDGSIYVAFPWKSQHPPLADNKALAFRRLESQYERLHAVPSAWSEYCHTFDRQLRSGVIEDVTDLPPTSPNTYYIPHQAVYKEDSQTIKLRIVFDASSHQKGHPSLNDCLHRGPSLIPDLVGTLLRSRLHCYLMIADVEKAFHQIHLHQNQRDCTRFLWLRDVHQPPSAENLRILRFTRVPFGINASPFLLNMSIRYFLERDPANRLKEEILANTYVDNVLIGANTTKECLTKQMECKEIFSRMHMNLREFMSNNQQTMLRIPKEDCMTLPGRFVKLLGIKWDLKLDVLHVPVEIARQEVSSKRTALQVYISLFDPLGLLTLLLIRPKMFIQDLWESGYSWDDPLDESTTQKWNTIVQEISGFHLRLPRFVGYPSANAYDLVICSDASKRVYAVAVYVVTRTSTYSPSSTLLFAKAKLAPSSAITIPRMELLACHMAAKTVRFLKSQLKIRFNSIRFLTDSQIVLYWIYSNKLLKTYVANRVKYIRQVLDELKSDNIDCGFYYLATDANPADCATCGLTALELENHIWWSGPSFITTPFADWPCKSFNASSDPPPGGDSEELRTTTAVVTSANTIMAPYQSFVPFRRTNSYIRLVRITAYVLKYVAKLRRLVRTRHSADDSDEHPLFGTIDASPTVTPGDFSAAELIVIREHYREVPQQLHGFHLKKLRTRQEGDGTIRVDLRMANAETSGTAKSPILILSGHSLCAMLIAHYHQKLFHAGTSHLIVALRERFYIPRLKRMVKSAIAKCVTCKRYQGHLFAYPRSPDLPPERMPQKIETSSRDNYESLKTQYRLLQTDLDYFWDIWHKEYLAALAERQAMRIQKGSGTKRSPVAKRSAKIKIGKRKIVDRALNHLLPLEISAADTEDPQANAQERRATRIQPSRTVKAK